MKKPTHAELLERVKKLEHDNQVLTKAVQEMHWMAVRYADKRETYAPHTLNEQIRACMDIGVTFQIQGLESIFARDRDEQAQKEADKSVPLMAIPQERLDRAPELLSNATCPHCGNEHPVLHSTPTPVVQVVHCPQSARSYVVGIRGKRVV